MKHNYVRNDDFVFRKIVDETILVPIRHNVAELNCIYTLNELGSLIWQELAEPKDLSALKQVVLETYDIDSEQASGDITEFLAELIEFGAVSEV